MTASAAAQGRAKAPSRYPLFLSRASRYMNRKPLRFCMYRLPPSFALRLTERRPVLLLRGRRRPVVLLASRHLHVLEQTPRRPKRALLRVSQRPSPRRIRRPYTPLLQRSPGSRHGRRR
jgi:hypothetical protein